MFNSIQGSKYITNKDLQEQELMQKTDMRKVPSPQPLWNDLQPVISSRASAMNDFMDPKLRKKNQFSVLLSKNKTNANQLRNSVEHKNNSPRPSDSTFIPGGGGDSQLQGDNLVAYATASKTLHTRSTNQTDVKMSKQFVMNQTNPTSNIRETNEEVLGVNTSNSPQVKKKLGGKMQQ